MHLLTYLHIYIYVSLCIRIYRDMYIYKLTGLIMIVDLSIFHFDLLYYILVLICMVITFNTCVLYICYTSIKKFIKYVMGQLGEIFNLVYLFYILP